METLNSVLAAKLQELRKDQHVKQEVLAKELKITQQAYSKLERGEVNFTNAMVSKICAFFDITVIEFLNNGSSVKIINSPNANTKANNSFNNDAQLLGALLESKDKLINTLEKQVALLEKR